MTYSAILAGIFIVVAFPACAGSIDINEANDLPAPELAARSFAQISGGFKDKTVQLVPTDTGYALFTAQFGAPMVEAAAGICRGRSIKFEYNWDEKNAAHADRIDVLDVYSVVGPIPEPQGPQDHTTTTARCAKLKSFGPGVFTADSESDAIDAMHLLNEVKVLAAGSKDFPLACTGNDCAHAKLALAALDMKNISEVQGCGERWFNKGNEHLCEAIMMGDDSQKAENGPDILIVKIEYDGGETKVAVMREHTRRPL